MDVEGILRVGGRLRQDDMKDGLKHPAIFPKISHITNLVLCYCHKGVVFQSRVITMNEINAC